MKTKTQWQGAGILLLILSLLAETLLMREPHHALDGFGFFAWYGFLASFGLIIAGKILGALLKRRDDYYDD